MGGSSDRLALDPMSSGMDPMQRLIARVSQLEDQVQRLGGVKVAPKTVTYNGFGAAIDITYTTTGGVLVAIAGAYSGVTTNSGGWPTATVELVVNGVVQDQSTWDTASSMIVQNQPQRPMMWSASTPTAQAYNVVVRPKAPLTVAGGFNARLMLIELPFVG